MARSAAKSDLGSARPPARGRSRSARRPCPATPERARRRLAPSTTSPAVEVSATISAASAPPRKSPASTRSTASTAGIERRASPADARPAPGRRPRRATSKVSPARDADLGTESSASRDVGGAAAAAVRPRGSPRPGRPSDSRRRRRWGRAAGSSRWPGFGVGLAAAAARTGRSGRRPARAGARRRAGFPAGAGPAAAAAAAAGSAPRASPPALLRRLVERPLGLRLDARAAAAEGDVRLGADPDRQQVGLGDVGGADDVRRQRQHDVGALAVHRGLAEQAAEDRDVRQARGCRSRRWPRRCGSGRRGSWSRRP